MDNIKERELFNELYNLYDKTKGNPEPFTFWVKKIKTKNNNIFNGGGKNNYSNVGIVKIGSSYSKSQFVGFLFTPHDFNSITLFVEKRHSQEDDKKFIEAAKGFGKVITVKQIDDFLEDINSKYGSWKYEVSPDNNINDALVTKMRDLYIDFFGYLKEYDSKNSTCFYEILKIKTTELDANIAKNEVLNMNAGQETFIEEETEIQIKDIFSNTDTKFFWINVDPNQWDVLKENEETYNKEGALKKATKGDLVIGYKTKGNPQPIGQQGYKCVVSIFVVSKIENNEVKINKLLNLTDPFLSIKDLKANSITENIVTQTASKKISKEQFVEIISMMIKKGVLKFEDLSKTIKNLINGEDTSSHPLNLILYGPPGTGKTYNTLFHALAIIEGKKVKDIENECKEFDKLHNDDPKTNSDDGYKKIKENYHYDDLVKKGQIVFTTFHQSMSYEDFIEGIKPIPPRNNEEQMVYDVQDGLFKQICEKAKKISVVNTSKKIDFSKTRIFKMSLGEKGKDADSVFEYCVENEVLALGWGDSKDFSTCKTRADFKKLDPTWGAAALEIFKEWMKTGDIVLISDGTKEVKGIAQVAGDYEFRDDPSIDMHQFRKAKWLYTGNNIPISKIYDKNLSQQSIYGFYKEKKGVVDNGGIKIDVLNEIITGEINDKKEENYVLIIDEINRGNVAQIFGELITLIEPSKRLGNDEEMTATLPYSQKTFGVPNNLYIIGTMNTADRSVEALDTALRRRFSFEEMMPKPKLLGDKELCDVKLSDLLTTINQRIVALKDREHQIGHSYFMGCPDDEAEAKIWLTNVFKDKIIPLLQEYFYGDYKKIYYVLGGSEKEGEGFVKIDSVKSDVFAVKIEDFEYDIPEKRYEIQKISDNFDIDKAIKMLLGKTV